ncbi:unnamed protein product, partial [Ectocarpus sp. 6 AP-2014]
HCCSSPAPVAGTQLFETADEIQRAMSRHQIFLQHTFMNCTNGIGIEQTTQQGKNTSAVTTIPTKCGHTPTKPYPLERLGRRHHLYHDYYCHPTSPLRSPSPVACLAP